MKKILITSLVIITVSCSTDPYNQGDMFFLVNKGAEMPVLVRGNINSGVLIIFLHGGPGGTALQKVGLPAFNKLEASYGVVFWDQRGSGSSQGNTADKYFTLNQFVEDLDKLIDLLAAKYNHPEIFLMGHSWGGCLGTAYLTDNDRQQKIKGWIEVDGAHNNPRGDNLSMEFVKEFGRQQIRDHKEEAYWNFVMQWYEENPDFTSDQLAHYTFVEKAHGYIHDPSVKRNPINFPEYSYSYLFDSPADATQALTNFNHVVKTFIVSDIDLTSSMKNITVPTLIVWGKFDGVIPYPLAEEAFNLIGSPNKSILTLDNSGHTGFYEEPDKFSAAILTFIARYK